MNKKVLIIGGSAVVALAGGFAYHRYHVNQKLIIKIQALLDDRTNATGTMDDFNDVFSGQVFIDKVNDKVTKAGKSFLKLKPEAVADMIKDLKAKLDRWTITNKLGQLTGLEKGDIISDFKSFKDKVQVAQAAQAYFTNYKVNLGNVLKDKMTQSHLKDIYNILQDLPNYRLSA